MDIIQTFTDFIERFRMRDCAFVLTIEICFCIKVNHSVCPQENLRSEEFILVQNARIESQIAQYLTLESIPPSSCTKVTMLKEVRSGSFLRGAFRGFFRHLEEDQIRIVVPDLLENLLVNGRANIIVSINKLQILPLRIPDSLVSGHRKPSLFLPDITDSGFSGKGREHLTTVVHNQDLHFFLAKRKGLDALQTSLQKGFRLVVIGDDERNDWLHSKHKGTKKSEK